jgi:molybdopterin molybdotransferase
MAQIVPGAQVRETGPTGAVVSILQAGEGAMSGTRFVDVRMRGFGPRAAVTDVLARLAAHPAPLPDESVPSPEAAGRVLAAAVASAVHVPGFERAAMDGYAVRGADVAGAGDAQPVELAVVGAAAPGRPFGGAVEAGQAVRITTGAPLPAGADAVLMAEFARAESGAHRVQALAPVEPGKHVIRVGEDVRRGSVVLPAGRRLRPQDIGLLASIGAAVVSVVRRPRVAILATGNELLPPGCVPSGFLIVDSNTPMLAALAARDGARVSPVRYVPDDFAAVRDAIREAASGADVVLVSGGTSVGTEDHAPRAAAELGELAVHGVALRPAGPLGVAFVPTAENDRPPVPVFLIPGNPVSCLCAYDLFAGRVVRALGGRAWELPYRTATLPLVAAVASAVGRVDYVRVKVDGGEAVPLAGGGAANLSTTVTADGFLLVPADRAALAPGELVSVWLYDG